MEEILHNSNTLGHFGKGITVIYIANTIIYAISSYRVILFTF